MPTAGSGEPVQPTGDPYDGESVDSERFVFGAAPVRERWWGRPLAETRAWLELGRLLVDQVWQEIGVPRGDGRPVILMPGFLAGGQALRVMAAWLKRLGYRPCFSAYHQHRLL